LSLSYVKGQKARKNWKEREKKKKRNYKSYRFRKTIPSEFKYRLITFLKVAKARLIPAR